MSTAAGTEALAGAEPKRDGADALCSGMDWLDDEAAHLERSLLRDCRRLAQVRLELQRSASLATELDANIARVESKQAKVAAELARRTGANARSVQQPAEPAAVRPPPPASGEVVGRVVGVLHARPDPALALARASAAQRTHTAGSEPAVPPGQPRGNNTTRASAQPNSQPASEAASPGVQQGSTAAGPKGKAAQAKPAAAAEEAGTEQAASRTELSKKQRQRLRRKEQLLGGGGGGGWSSEKQHGPDGCNLYVYHCPAGWDDQAIKQTFSPYGAIVSATIMKDQSTGASMGFGFVSFDNPIAAQQAIQGMNGLEVEGKRLRVELKQAAAATPERAGGAAQPSIARVPPSAPPSKPAAAASGQQQRALAEGQGTPKRGLAVGSRNKCAWVAAPQATPQPPAQASTAPATSQASGAPSAAGNSSVQQRTPDTSRATPATAAVRAHKAAAESGQQPRAQSKPGASATLPVATEHATALTQALPPQGEETLPKAFKSVSVERSKEDASLCTRDKATFDAAVVASDGGGLRPGSIPMVSSLMLFKHEPAQAIEPKDWRQEEHVFGVFARVAARRPLVNKIDTVHSESLRSFCAHTASIVLCECREASASGLGPLRECRQDLVAACRTAGLEELDELKLGLAHASQEGQGSASGLRLANGLFEIPPGYLELVEAAAAAGAVRVVRSGGEWHVQRGERVRADEVWSPPAVDVSLKFGVSNQCLPVVDGERVDETRLMFQVKSVPKDFFLNNSHLCT
jgi:hypothetical protein